MRLVVIAGVLLAAIASAGCLRFFDVTGCMGEASWTEPGIFAWVQEHGFAHGFGPPINSSGLENVLPNGTLLQYAIRQVPAGSTKILFSVAGTSGNFNVDRSPGQRAPSAEVLRQVWDETFDAVYAGNDASREAARRTFLRDEWMLKDDGSVQFQVQNAWSFDQIIGSNASFVRAGDGTSFELRSGEWLLIATPPEWQRNWETVSRPHLSRLSISPTNQTEIMFWYVDEEEEAKDLVRRELTAFAWTFQDWGFETECPAGY